LGRASGKTPFRSFHVRNPRNPVCSFHVDLIHKTRAPFDHSYKEQGQAVSPSSPQQHRVQNSKEEEDDAAKEKEARVSHLGYEAH
jgi:hypothetical protein